MGTTRDNPVLENLGPPFIGPVLQLMGPPWWSNFGTPPPLSHRCLQSYDYRYSIFHWPQRNLMEFFGEGKIIIQLSGTRLLWQLCTTCFWWPTALKWSCLLQPREYQCHFKISLCFVVKIFILYPVPRTNNLKPFLTRRVGNLHHIFQGPNLNIKSHDGENERHFCQCSECNKHSFAID